MARTTPLLYERLSWPEVRHAVREDRVCLIPAGTLEDHGPHLPLDTDVRIASEICRRAAERIPDEVVLLPPVVHGYTPHHMDFPGPITIGWDTFVRYCTDVGTSLARHGFKRILFLNGHGSNIPLLDVAARLIAVDYEPLQSVLDVRAAMRPDAPLLHETLFTRSLGRPATCPSNVASHTQSLKGDPDRGFAQADLMVEREFRTATVHQGYLEPHACSSTARSAGTTARWPPCRPPATTPTIARPWPGPIAAAAWPTATGAPGAASPASPSPSPSTVPSISSPAR